METVDSLEREIAERAVRAGLFGPNDRVLVAVSGGRDSAATAALLAAARDHGLALDLTLGHVDHGWRGPDETAADLAVVEELGRLLGLPVERHGPPHPVRRTEDAARRHRYSSLETLALRIGASAIATGHHLRDQAETYVMRLRRGSGPAGLAGIPARRPIGIDGIHVVRPVLSVEPRRLAEYAASRGLPFRDDPTNALLDRDRARVRAELTALGSRAESEARVLADAADGFARALARREDDVRSRLGRSLLLDPEAGYVEVDAADFAALGDAEHATGLRILGSHLHASRGGPWFARRHAQLVGALAARPRGALDLPRDLRVERVGSRLSMLHGVVVRGPDIEVPRESRVVRACATATVEAGWTEVGRTEFDLEAWRAATRSAPGRPPHAAVLDADRLGRRATLRVMDLLDRFEPHGGRGAVEIGSFVGKQGLPNGRRPGVRVLEADDGGIAWVVGHRIDRRYAITDETTRVARLDVDVRAR